MGIILHAIIFHAQFQNTRISPSGRKLTGSEEERKKEEEREKRRY